MGMRRARRRFVSIDDAKIEAKVEVDVVAVREL
jgi:hypothetical protein